MKKEILLNFLTNFTYFRNTLEIDKFISLKILLGFIEGIRENKLIKCVTLYKLMNSAAVNAAVLAAKNCNYILPVQQISIVFDTIMF